MSVHPEKPHIFTDLKKDLFIYRILLLSPFEILRNQQLAITWRVKVYVYTVLLVFAMFRMHFIILLCQNDEIVPLFLFNGQLWILVDLFDFVFAALSFGGIVINALVTKNYQMDFYEKLYDFDVKLKAVFGISIDRSRTRDVYRFALIASLAYFAANSICGLINFSDSILTTYQNFALFSTYYLSNILTFASALQYVNCTQLCRERLQFVRKILRNFRNCPSEHLDKVLELYTRISNQVILINRFMGFVVLIKVTHDFTLGTSVVYILCSADYEFMDVLNFVWWFSLTVIGTLLINLEADMLMTEVSKIGMTIKFLV